MSECAKEKIHCGAINQEKAAYKETLDRLGGLKGSIEKIQQLVEDLSYRQTLIHGIAKYVSKKAGQTTPSQGVQQMKIEAKK